ncbi:DNA polymerase I, partial [bacterium]|nr:DNA polymerase I [bacterium]
LAERLGIPVKEAKQYIESYLDRFSGVKNYIDQTKSFVTEHGFVSTLLGRQRPIPMAMDKRHNIKEMGFRQAINMRIQGTAADIIKIAMISIHDEIITNKLKSKMVLQIHDELLFDVLPNELDTLSLIVRNKMENAFKLRVPLTVDINTGNNWSEAH